MPVTPYILRAACLISEVRLRDAAEVDSLAGSLMASGVIPVVRLFGDENMYSCALVGRSTTLSGIQFGLAQIMSLRSIQPSSLAKQWLPGMDQRHTLRRQARVLPMRPIFLLPCSPLACLPEVCPPLGVNCIRIAYVEPDCAIVPKNSTYLTKQSAITST